MSRSDLFPPLECILINICQPAFETIRNNRLDLFCLIFDKLHTHIEKKNNDFLLHSISAVKEELFYLLFQYEDRKSNSKAKKSEKNTLTAWNTSIAGWPKSPF